VIDTPLLYQVPVIVSLFIFLVVLSAALEVGFRVGLRRFRLAKDPDSDSGGGGLVQNATFALLGLMLAFTYGYTVNHYETRKRDVIDEANRLGSAFLRAGLAKERGGVELQKALLDYSRTRVIQTDTSAQVIQESVLGHAKIWAATERVVKAGPPGVMESGLVESVTSVFDKHGERVAAAFDFLPPVVMWTLLFIASVSVALGGYGAGLSGQMCRLRTWAFTVVLSITMHLIVDFDRSRGGLIQVSQKPMIQAVADMEAALAANR
jgi:hypothetical protein